MQKYIELLRKPMQVKPESLRAARQKSSSTPPHVYRLNYNESPYGLGPLSEEALEKSNKNSICLSGLVLRRIKKPILQNCMIWILRTLL